MKRLWGIDPGTNCGWAVRTDRGIVASGVWSLKESRYEGGGMRFVRLRGYLNELAQTYPPNIVAFEEVRAHKGVDASHIYGGIVATIQTFCEDEKLPYTAVPVGQVKKLATGKGNSPKLDMIAATVTRWGSRAPLQWDDNEADARWIAEAAWITPSKEGQDR